MAFLADRSHYYLNLSNFYVAMVMVAPMGLIMLFVMRSMFPSRRLNLGPVVLFGAWLIGRQQVGVGNELFLRDDSAPFPGHPGLRKRVDD